MRKVLCFKVTGRYDIHWSCRLLIAVHSDCNAPGPNKMYEFKRDIYGRPM